MWIMVSEFWILLTEDDDGLWGRAMLLGVAYNGIVTTLGHVTGSIIPMMVLVIAGIILLPLHLHNIVHTKNSPEWERYEEMYRRSLGDNESDTAK